MTFHGLRTKMGHGQRGNFAGIGKILHINIKIFKKQSSSRHEVQQKCKREMDSIVCKGLCKQEWQKDGLNKSIALMIFYTLISYAKI